MTTLRALLSFVVVFTAGLSYCSGLAQQSVPGSPDGSSAATVHLEPHDGKTQFKLGDPITLDLVVSPQLGNQTNFLTKITKVNITPAEGWSQIRTGTFDSVETHDQNPVHISLPLTQVIVFRQPGYYTVTITTTRLNESSTGEIAPAAVECCRATANAIQIDISPRGDREEAELVARLTNRLEKKPDTFPSDDFTKLQKPLLDELMNVSKDPRAAD